MHQRKSNYTGNHSCRRTFIKNSVGIAAGIIVSPSVHAASQRSRTLSFFNLHTSEHLNCTYWSNGRYDDSALEDISFVLRDFRTNEVKPIDPRLLDLLTTIRIRLSSSEEFHVISGYRSPKTNAMLNARSTGVAKRSLHMQGKAIDVRLTSVPVATLWQAGKELNLGGVGYYPKSRFVHLDVGRPRRWTG